MFRITIENDAFEVGLDRNPEQAPQARIVGLSAKGRLHLRLLSGSRPDMWLGRWITRNLEVHVGRVGAGLPAEPLTAAVNDRTGEAPLSFADAFLPGVERIVTLSRSPLSAVIASQTADPVHRRRLVAAARKTLSRRGRGVPGKRAMVVRFRSVMARSGVPPRISHVVGGALATLVQGGGAVAFLDAYVVLHLYEAVQNGASLGPRLGYQRYASTGERICNALLSPSASIR